MDNQFWRHPALASTSFPPVLLSNASGKTPLVSISMCSEASVCRVNHEQLVAGFTDGEDKWLSELAPVLTMSVVRAPPSGAGQPKARASWPALGPPHD